MLAAPPARQRSYAGMLRHAAILQFESCSTPPKILDALAEHGRRRGVDPTHREIAEGGLSPRFVRIRAVPRFRRRRSLEAVLEDALRHALGLEEVRRELGEDGVVDVEVL